MAIYRPRTAEAAGPPPPPPNVGNAYSKTLRDEFAMAAIQMEHVQNYGAMTATDMAQRAYQIADAMLAARRG